MRTTLKLLGLLLAIGLTGSASMAIADVNDFEFESFDARYELTINKSAGNIPEMMVTETLVALFPETDQNRGIRRDIPARSYGDYPGLIKIVSVTDETGKARDFEETREEGFVALAIKAQDDSFVYGRQTYVIKYRQSWVIGNFQDSSGFDEFYWDINGTGWLQRFNRVSAEVILDQFLEKNLVLDGVSCFQGITGSDLPCDELQLSENKMVFIANNLEAGENLTVAIPFKPNLVNTAGPKVEGTLTWYLFWVAPVLLVLLLFWAIFFRIFGIRSQGKKDFIVPHYAPAEEPGLLASGLIANKTANLKQALVVELAVKKDIEIQAVAGSDKDFVLRRAQGAPESHELLRVLGLLRPGDQVTVGPRSSAAQNSELSSSISKFIADAKKKVNREGFFLARTPRTPVLVFAVAILIFILWFFLGALLDLETEAGFLLAPMLCFVPFAVIYWLLLSKRALSAKGSQVVSYLKGLEMYIKLAEKDRLEFLQSPKGALLKPSEIQGEDVLKLYEKVLPWAILLGLQKQWSQVLTALYQKEGSPAWYLGDQLAYANLSNLNKALSSSLAVSSSGGSGGSGFSGGGSGGGGGRGL